MDSLLQDVRYALRVLARAPAFTAIALVTLAIGVGANATVFSFVSALLLRPAPGVADPRSLVAIYTSDFSSGPYGDSSYPDFLSLKAEAPAFESMAAAQDDAIGIVQAGDTVERVRMSSVTGGYFNVLGLRPVIGRLLTDADTHAGAPPVAVIGFNLWKRLFEHAQILGTPLKVNGMAYEVVGVAPDSFEGLDLGRAFEIWTPLLPPAALPEERGNRSFSIIARLRRGTMIAEAQAQVSGIAVRLARDYPKTNLGTLAAPKEPRPMFALRHTRIGPEFRGMVAQISAILMAAVGLVLLIACANIASLLLSRAAARSREMAIRIALGAGRHRIMRQLLTESLLVGIAGGALGLLFSLWTADLLPSFFPAEQARMLDTALDARVFLFVLSVSLISSVIFGLAPALQATRPISGATLRGAAERVSDSPTSTRLRRVLVASQVALAVVLLVSAALLVQSLVNAVHTDLGFGTTDGVIASMEVPASDFPPERGLGHYARVVERVKSLSGVEAAAVTRSLPLSRRSRRGFRIEGYEFRPGEDRELTINVVGYGYFEAMRIPLLAGRTFDSRDSADTRPAVIVDDLLARKYFHAKAVGRQLIDSRGTSLEVIGVVGSVKNLTPQDPAVPTVYYPLAQNYESRMTLIARTAGNPRAMIDPIRREMQSVNRSVPVFRTITLSSHLSEAVAGDRLTATLVGVCGGMALLLAAIGLYGVIAYAVARRLREFGVRLALGAQPHHIVRLVLGEGLGITVGGLALGIVGAAAATPALRSFLYGVNASDPATYAAVTSVLAIVAVIAGLAPARRALRVEPNLVLRQD
jgi:predicted permease